MQVSAANRLSWRTVRGSGPRQTTAPGLISNRNVEGGLPPGNPPPRPTICLHPVPQNPPSAASMGWLTPPFVITDPHLIFLTLAAEDLPTRHTTGRRYWWRAYE